MIMIASSKNIITQHHSQQEFFMKTIKCLLFPIFIIAGDAKAYLVNGEMLIEDISRRKALATGYIEGVSDTANNKVFCIPEGTTSGMLRKVAKQYLESHTDELSLPAASLVMEAFTTEYPCS
jgi:hypothetical protein